MCGTFNMDCTLSMHKYQRPCCTKNSGCTFILFCFAVVLDNVALIGLASIMLQQPVTILFGVLQCFPQCTPWLLTKRNHRGHRWLRVLLCQHASPEKFPPRLHHSCTCTLGQVVFKISGDQGAESQVHWMSYCHVSPAQEWIRLCDLICKRQKGSSKLLTSSTNTELTVFLVGSSTVTVRVQLQRWAWWWFT